MPRYTRRRSQQQEMEHEPEQELELAEEQEQIEEPQLEYSGERPESINEFLRKYLRVLTRPSFVIFRQEVKNPTWRNILVQLAALAVITLLPILAIGIPTYFAHPPFGNNPVAYSIYVIVGTLLSMPLSFFAVAAAAYFAAKALNGVNTIASVTLKTVSYAIALFYVPIGIIMTILGLFLGFNATLVQFYLMLFFAFSLYLTALVFLATQALFEMNLWKAVTLGVIIAVAVVFIYNFIGPVPFNVLGAFLHIKNG